jgi:hypothetical protein
MTENEFAQVLSSVHIFVPFEVIESIKRYWQNSFPTEDFLEMNTNRSDIANIQLWLDEIFSEDDDLK